MASAFDVGLHPLLRPQEPEHILQCFSSKGGEEEIDRVAALLEQIRNPTDAQDALGLAVKRWRVPAIEILLGHSLVDVNGPLRNREYPALFVACSQRNEGLIRALLQAGADPRTYPTVLHALAKCPPCADFDVSVACISLILQAGADLHHPDHQGRQPLHCTSDAHIAQALLEAGADPDARDANGLTLAHTTTRIPVLEVLASRANFNLRDTRRGQTPLVHSLTRLPWPDATKKALWLINHGADVVVADEEGNSALHYFVNHSPPKSEGASLDLLQALLSAGSNAKLRNGRGQTPLHMLSRPTRNGDMSQHILHQLMQFGADCNAKDDLGQTPLFKIVDGWFRCNDILDFILDLPTAD